MTEVQDYTTLFALFRRLLRSGDITALRDIKGNRLPLLRKVHRRRSGIIFPLTRLIVADRSSPCELPFLSRARFGYTSTTQGGSKKGK